MMQLYEFSKSPPKIQKLTIPIRDFKNNFAMYFNHFTFCSFEKILNILFCYLP